MKRTCIRFLLLSVFAVMMIAFAPVKTMAATDVSNWDEFYNAIDHDPEIVLQGDITVPEATYDLYQVAYLRTPTVFADLTALSSGGTAKGVSQKSLASVEIHHRESAAGRHEL